MGFKTFLSARSSRRSRDSTLNPNNSPNHNSQPPMLIQPVEHKPNASERITSSVRKAMHIHRRDSVAPNSPHLAVVPEPKPLYRFRSPKQQKTKNAPSPTVTSDLTVVESESPSPSDFESPPSTAGSEPSTPTPINKNDATVTQVTISRPEEAAQPTELETALADMRAAEKLLQQRQTIIARPAEKAKPTELETTVSAEKLHHQRQAIIAEPAEEAKPTELETAMADMRAAEKLLQQRHAVIKPQPNMGKKVTPLGALIKKGSPNGTSLKLRLPLRLSPIVRRSSPKACQPSGLSQAELPPPAHRQQPQTADEACAALQRRQLIKNLAFNAANGCPTAIADIDQVNAHSAIKFRHPDIEMSDLVLTLNGVEIRTSEFTSVERNWITRFNALTNNATLVERRLMSAEDHEVIVTQLFAEERDDILKPEHFEIFVTGLGEEGILTKSQAKAIARLGVTVEEFDKGATFTGPSKHAYCPRNDPNQLVIFHIPKEAGRVASFSPYPSKSQGHSLYYYLRILAEAAVYGQQYWKGYFFANARSKLDDFYAAYKIDSEDWLLPAHLTEYKRSWTSREIRLLQRAQLICELLKQYETGRLTDFGLVRAVRATFIQIPAQPYFSVEELESFLYHRVTGSGLPVAKIPEMLFLHPENDAAAADHRLRNHVMNGLKERANQFIKEEEQRLKEIETSYTTFESTLKAQMTRWERVKAGFKKLFGKKEVVVPFDPFAPEHEG